MVKTCCLILLPLACCSEYSMQLNASRIKVLQAQDDLVNSMKEAGSKELLNVSQNGNSYKKLLKDLIVQVVETIFSAVFNYNFDFRK